MKLIHTEILYSASLFRWQKISTDHPVATEKIVTAEEFARDNSAADANGAQVNFRELGIRAKGVEQVTIHHPPANITGATAEIPGDAVLLKNPDAIIFSVCNLYFEARRVKPKHK